MPTAKLDKTLEMYYEDDDYTDPWRTPDHQGAIGQKVCHALCTVRRVAGAGLGDQDQGGDVYLGQQYPHGLPKNTICSVGLDKFQQQRLSGLQHAHQR